MKLIDNYHLLTANQTQLLHQNVGEQFSFGGFKSLDDILTQLDVDVIIEPGIVYHSVPESLNELEAFWKRRAEREAQHNDCPIHLRDLSSHKGDWDNQQKPDNCEGHETARAIYEKIRKEKDELSHTLILGLYDLVKNCIILYPEAMMQVYGGKWMDELLVSTLAHETMHAYFNRPGHDKYPYIYHVEEPLAEFGMLVYLHQTGSSYYNWAFNEVNSKRTCYRCGAFLMNQSDPSYRNFLQKFKVGIPMRYRAPSGTISMPTTRMTKRDIIKTAFDNLYADLLNDLTFYLLLNLIIGEMTGMAGMTRTPATIQLTNGSFIDVWKWAPTGSSRAILLEVKKADYPQMNTEYKNRDRYFPDPYEAKQLYPDSVFLLSNQWGGGSDSFNHIIDGFCDSVNMVGVFLGVQYYSPANVTYLKTPVKGITPPTKSASTPTASPTSPTSSATPEEP